MKPAKKNLVALLVSDGEELVLTAKPALDELGFDTVVAIDAVHAAQAIEEHSPDFVCTDLILPRGSGYDVCRLVRGSPNLQGVPLMVVDDRGLPEEMAFAEEEAGADVFLTWPFTTDEFRHQVRAMFGGEPSRPRGAPMFEGDGAGGFLL